MSNNFHRNRIKENDIIKEIISKYDDILNNKNIINEDLNLLNTGIYITESPQSVDTSKYSSIDFKDRIVGSSTPSKDKINPSLLSDLDKAAKIAGTKASVTTAVTGHRPGTRHESGLAVDLAMFDGKGYGSKDDAIKKGIYDKIEKFVRALESMGYKVNSERGNDKAVLWFGFPNHHHHVHVSRKSDDGTSTPSSSQNSDNNSDDSSKTAGVTTTDTTTNDVSGDTKNTNTFFNLFGGGELMKWLDMFSPSKKSGNEKQPIKNSQNTETTNDTKKTTNDTKLPSGVLSSIEKLKKSPYNLNITQDHIDKELKMEGGSRPDNGGVNKEAEKKVKELIKDCKLAYPNVKYPSDIVSGYRSYDNQVLNFGSKAKTRGIDDTQKSVALPGFSQHHTGKAFDIFSVESSWWGTNKDVKEWVSKNASKYGFEVTYVNTGKLRVPEPWHLYYIGGSSNSTSNITENKKTHKMNEEVNRMKDLMKKNL